MYKGEKQKAKVLLKEVLESRTSDFYKHKYRDGNAEAFIRGEGRWEDIPFLTRKELEETPVRDRLYTSESETGLFRSTSGTSGRKLPILAQSYVVKEEHHPPFRRWCTEGEFAATRSVTFGTGCWTEESHREELGMHTLLLDAGDVEASTNLMRIYKPQHVIGFGYAISAVGRALQGTPAAEEVTIIKIYGERCSTLQWEKLHEYFPNALVLSQYSAIELQRAAGLSCRYIAEQKRQHLHAIPGTAIMEVIDRETLQPIVEGGVMGELVVTGLMSALSMPMLRYRTGDAAQIISKVCPCGLSTPVLSIEGRLQIDHIRMRGGEINLPEVDRVVAAHKRYLTDDDFELHYGEETTAEGDVMPSVTLHLSWNESLVNAVMLADSCARELRVAPGRTYAQGVTEGLYVPLRLERLTQRAQTAKRKRIIKQV